MPTEAGSAAAGEATAQGYRSPWLERPGAVAALGSDAGVAAHYGDPVREQRLLEGGDSLVDLSNRGVLTITGPDRLSWIDSISSQSVARLQPGESAETLILDPSGRVEHAVRLLDDGATLWLLMEHDEAGPLLAWLERMRFMLRVELADRGADFATVGSFGPVAVEVASPGDVPLVWSDPWTAVVAGGWQYAVGEHPGAAFHYRETLVEREVFEGSEAAASGTLALEALRIAAWRPRFAAEVDERTIPHELDWLRSAVHLSKGCYRGQETVAKVHNLGHPPRRLVLLHLDGSDGIEVAAGDDVVASGDDEKLVGHVTSVARHHELGPIALAVVKRTADPFAELLVAAADGRVAAAQELIVPTGAGAEANVPRLPRLGAVTRPRG